MEAEELVADMHPPRELVRRRDLARDEQQLAHRLHKRIAERYPAAQAQSLGEEQVTQVAVGRIDLGGFPFKGRKLVQQQGEGGLAAGRNLALKVFRQGACTPESHIERIAILGRYQRFHVGHLVGRRLVAWRNRIRTGIRPYHVPISDISLKKPPCRLNLLTFVGGRWEFVRSYFCMRTKSRKRQKPNKQAPVRQIH